MPVLQSCCCFKTLKTGSFVSAVYTLIFYTMLLTAGSFHIHTVIDDIVLLSFTLTMVALAALCVITSILLIIGLCGDNKSLLIPWLVILSLITTLDVAVSTYLLCLTTYNPFIMALFVIDFVVCSVNIYCILAVISQYQIIKYLDRCRGRVSKSVATDYDDFADCQDFDEDHQASPPVDKQPKAASSGEATVLDVAVIDKRIREKGRVQAAVVPATRSRSLTGTPNRGGLGQSLSKELELSAISEEHSAVDMATPSRTRSTDMDFFSSSN